MPQDFPGLPDILYRNEGNGRFRDVTASAGVAGSGRGMGVLAADLDGDGRLDWLVANDACRATTFGKRNRGDGTFEDVADQLGVAVNGQGLAEANMGIAFGDTDGNGLPDVVITHFYGEHTTLWRGYATACKVVSSIRIRPARRIWLSTPVRSPAGVRSWLTTWTWMATSTLWRPTGTSAASRPSSMAIKILPSSSETRGMRPLYQRHRRALVRISRQGFMWGADWPAAISTVMAILTSSSSIITPRALCSGMNLPAEVTI